MIARRRLVQALALAGSPITGALYAEQYPSRPIRLLVPVSAGQSLDIIARYFSDALAKRMGVAVLVENRPGAGVMLGTEHVAKAPADGYTVLFGSMPHFVTPYLAERPPAYDPVRDFAPIAMLAKTSLGIVVGSESPFRTLADLVSAMKAKPGEITFASGGNGTAAHLCMTLLNDVTETRVRHVPYKSTMTGVTDVASGLVNFSCQGSGSILGYLKSGKLRLLGVTGHERWDVLPKVQTAVESGLPGLGSLNGWIGVLARAGTPAAVIQRLSDEFVHIARQPEFKVFCDAQEMAVNVLDHRQFAAEVPKIAAFFKRLALLAKEDTARP